MSVAHNSGAYMIHEQEREDPVDFLEPFDFLEPLVWHIIGIFHYESGSVQPIFQQKKKNEGPLRSTWFRSGTKHALSGHEQYPALSRSHGRGRR
jgi:hypothetical protein